MKGDLTEALEDVIMCVDMDAFFASVEQRADPRLRGRPVAVVGSEGRTVVTTASYEARARGVKTGMSMWEAVRTCRGLVVVVGRPARYTHTCKELASLYGRYTPDMEVYSVDEAFLDVTTTHHLFGGPAAIGRQIKEAVRDRFGINCTVGVGPNVLLAKLASDLGKPDGLRLIAPAEVEAVLEDLPVDRLWGIGGKTAQRLADLGIRTCGQLGRAPASLLRNRFGIVGETLGRMGAGRLGRPVLAEEGEPRSIGHSNTLPRDISDRAEMEAHILDLSERVARRARRHGYVGRKVTLVVRYSDFETFSRQSTLRAHTDDARAICRSACEVLRGLRLRDRVRLLGVSLSCLARDPGQLVLMEDERKRRAVLRAMDEINDRFGRRAINWAACIEGHTLPGVISPAWRPGGVRHVKVEP